MSDISLILWKVSGIMDEFKIEISEDYDDLKEDEDFIHLLGEAFTLEDADRTRAPCE